MRRNLVDRLIASWILCSCIFTVLEEREGKDKLFQLWLLCWPQVSPPQLQKLHLDLVFLRQPAVKAARQLVSRPILPEMNEL